MATSPASGTVADRLSAFQSRPGTSFDSNRSPTRIFPRKPRSFGNLAGQLDGANELLEARARLRRVGENRSLKKVDTRKPEAYPTAAVRRRRTNSSVLEELDVLLDTAIGEHTKQLTNTNSRDTTDTTQAWPLPRSQSFTSKSPSKYASRRSINAANRRRSQHRHSRTTSDFDNSTHARSQSSDSNMPRSSTDIEAGSCCEVPSEMEREPIKSDISSQLQNNKSPIKHRAALFEKLSHHDTAVVHDVIHPYTARNPLKIRGMWPPKQVEQEKVTGRVEFISSLQNHHMKFHPERNEVLANKISGSPPKSSSRNKPRKSHEPPIPLTLPQLVSSRRQSQPDVTSSDNSFTTAPQTKHVPTVPVIKPKDERKTSWSWPLKWDLSKKSPDATTKESGVVARAEPDHHMSAKKTYENQHRVHDLLVAAKESGKEPCLEPESERHERGPSASPCRPMPGQLAETPRGSSGVEKEVVSSSSATPVGTVTPSTPRGRRRMQNLDVVTHSPADDKDGNFKLEQRFTLSRSRSRGRGIRVQLDIRSPKPSPERDSDHTIVVTANVEPIEEEDDAFGQPD